MNNDLQNEKTAPEQQEQLPPAPTNNGSAGVEGTLKRAAEPIDEQYASFVWPTPPPMSTPPAAEGLPAGVGYPFAPYAAAGVAANSPWAAMLTSTYAPPAPKKQPLWKLAKSKYLQTFFLCRSKFFFFAISSNSCIADCNEFLFHSKGKIQQTPDGLTHLMISFCASCVDVRRITSL